MNKGTQRRFSCDVCGKEYANKARVKFHLKNFHQEATNSTVCGICDGRYSTPTSLRKHVERVHTRKRDVLCTKEGCNMSFFTNKDRADHLRNKHRVNMLKCENCRKEFAYKRNLKRHNKSCGKAVKDKHQCKICGKKYCSSEALSMHENIKHTNVKQFICEMCGKVFDRNFTHARHVRTVHQLD